VFDTTSHGLLAKLNHSSEVGAAEFSPDSQLLITATNDGVARLFEWKREAEVGQILLDGPTTSIIIDQDPIRGPIAALINWHNKVERVPLYDSRAVSLKDEAGSLQVALLGQQSAEFSPDGLTLVLADNKALSYFDVASGALMHSVSLSKQTRVRGLSVSERAQMAALIDSGTAMLLRDNKRLESIDSPSDVKQSALKITLSSTGGLVALASSSGLSEDVSNVKVLDVRKSRLPWLFSCGGEPRALAISPDDATIMVGTSEGKVCIGDLRTRESIQEPYSSDPVTAIAIDKRSGIIAVGTETGKVYFGSRDRVGHGMKSFFLREIAGIKNKFRKVFSWEPPSLGSSITSITFAEHGDTVVVSTKGQTLHVIEAASGKEITKFNVQGLKTFIVTSNRIKALIAYGQAPYIVSYPMTLKDLIDEACQYGERRDLTDVERKVFGLDNFLYVTPCPSKL
jgi:WD40 repeat protein